MDELRIPIVKAHANSWHADRFKGEKGFCFRVRGTRQHPAGTYIDTEPPELVVPDIFPTCEYCGSITPADFLKALQTPGAHYSGSDWKYGYPHKFYIDIPCEPFKRSMSASYSTNEQRQRVIVVDEWKEDRKRTHKFYTEHLLDATVEELEEWARVAEPMLGVRFVVNDGKLAWHAVPGVQRYGVVG